MREGGRGGGGSLAEADDRVDLCAVQVVGLIENGGQLAGGGGGVSTAPVLPW